MVEVSGLRIYNQRLLPIGSREAIGSGMSIEYEELLRWADI